MAAAAAAAEFRARDRDDLDAGLAQKRVGVGVAVVGDHDAGLQGDDIVAVVPLLALCLLAVAAGLDDAQLLQAQRLPDDLEDRLLLRADVEAVALVAVG